MVDRRLLAVVCFLTTACGASDLPPRYHEVLGLFREARPHLIAIEQELDKDGLWQLVPKYVDGTFNEPHFPALTASQTVKYRKMLELVAYVGYIDKTEDRTDFSLGSETIDRWEFAFQFVHTSQRARPAPCTEISIGGESGVCSLDLGDDWSLWVTWIEASDEEGK